MKKRFTLMLIAALVAVVSFAQQGKWSGVSSRNNTIASTTEKSGIQGKAAKHLDFKAASRRAVSFFPIITEAPEGETKYYKRSGQATTVSGQQAINVKQSGIAELVFAEDGVYFKDIINSYSVGSYVKGSLSADGKTLTVPLKQNIYYSSDYDAAVMIVVGTLTTGFTRDQSVNEITYTIEGETITLNLAEDYVLSCIWTDDFSWTGYSEWETVLTEYNEDLTPVTPPEGLNTVEAPFTGKIGAPTSTGDVPFQDFASTVKYGFDGNDVYIFLDFQLIPSAWIKGTLEDNIIKIEPQYLGSDLQGNKIFIGGYSEQGDFPTASMEYDAENNTINCFDYIVLNSNSISLSNESLYYIVSGAWVGERPSAIVAPANLETESLYFEGTNYYYDFEGTAEVGFADDIVYIQGIIPELPEAWLAGTWTDDTKNMLMIPAGQFIGCNEDGISYFVLGYDEEEEEVDNIYFEYDAKKGQFELLNTLYLNSKQFDIYFFDLIEEGFVIGVKPDVSWKADDMGLARATVVSDVAFGEGITGVFAKAEGSNDPKYYTATNSDVEAGHPEGTVRMYPGNTLTINSTEPLGKIVLHLYSSDDKQMQIELSEESKGEFELDGYKGVWEGNATSITFNVPNKTGYQGRITKIDFYYLDYTKATVEVPENLVTEAYRVTAHDPYWDEDVAFEVQIGFDGNDVYFQGLSNYIKEAWVKGTLADGKVTIPNWNLGIYTSIYGSVELIFGGAEFIYDAATSTFTCADGYISYEKDSNFAMDEFDNVNITKITEKAVKPANPAIASFNVFNTSFPNVNLYIPTVDVNGEPILTGKLSYQLFIEKNSEVTPLILTENLYTHFTEDMSEIPYNFTDDYDITIGGGTVYLNQDVEEILSWSKIGVQSIYYGGNETNKSDIVWFDIQEYVSGIDNVAAEENSTSVSYFDLQGRRVSSATRGIVIKQVRYSNGKVTRTKMLR